MSVCGMYPTLGSFSVDMRKVHASDEQEDQAYPLCIMIEMHMMKPTYQLADVPM